MQKIKEKKTLFLQTKDSPVFSEAYFLLKEEEHETTESEMVLEANRILGNLEQNLPNVYQRRRAKRHSPLCYFIFGMLFSFAATACCFLSFIFFL